MDLGTRIAIAVGAAVIVLVAVVGVYLLFLRRHQTDDDDDRREPAREASEDGDEDVALPRKKRKKKKSALTYEERLKQRKAQFEEEKQARQNLISDVVESANLNVARAHDKSKRKRQARAMAVNWWKSAPLDVSLSGWSSCDKCFGRISKGDGFRCMGAGMSAAGLVCEKCFMASDYQPWDGTLARIIDCLNSRNAMLIEDVLPLSMTCPQCQASFIVKDGWEVVALNCPKCRHCVHRCAW